MLIYGRTSYSIPFGQSITKRCAKCDLGRRFAPILTYRIFHIWFAFGCVRDQELTLICETCGTVERARPGVGVSNFPSVGHDAIPFMHRYGLALLIGVLSLPLFLALALEAMWR